jgi:dTDP-4-dehydrorhamnose reductase
MIFLTAALTHVDLCEENPEKAIKINVEGPRLIAGEAARLGVKLVFFSTDYIFDGEAGPYDENAMPRPLNVYGQTKLDAEEAIKGTVEDSLIIRTTVVYGWEPDSKNFAMQVYQRVRAGEQFTVPSDQVSNPTLVEYLAQVTVQLALLEVKGIVNVVGKDLVTRAEFAGALVRTFGGNPPLVVPVLTAKLRQKARRPLKGGLRTNKVAELLGPNVAMSLDDAMTRLRHRYMNAQEYPSRQRPS